MYNKKSFILKEYAIWHEDLQEKLIAPFLYYDFLQPVFKRFCKRTNWVNPFSELEWKKISIPELASVEREEVTIQLAKVIIRNNRNVLSRDFKIYSIQDLPTELRKNEILISTPFQVAQKNIISLKNFVMIGYTAYKHIHNEAMCMHCYGSGSSGGWNYSGPALQRQFCYYCSGRGKQTVFTRVDIPKSEFRHAFININELLLK